MHINRRVLAIIIDGSIDFSLGVISAAVISYFLNEPLSWWLLIVGIAGAYAPDLDGLYFFAKKGAKNAESLYTHRSGLHYPLILVPLATIILILLGLFFYESSIVLVTGTFVLGLLFHFIHDTFLHGWGIPWLGKYRVALFPHTTKNKPLSKVYIFAVKDLHSLVAEFRDPYWYQLFYKFPPHPWMYVIVIVHTIGMYIVLS
jgi:hypothetical protein